MFKYAKITNTETKACEVGSGTNTDFYKSIGMVEMEVEQAYNGDWYLKGYAPEKPAPTKEEVSETRRQLYIAQVDPITAHINRLKDEEQTEEVIAQIEALKSERAEVVAKIKEENPYPEE
jgi:YbbR domain-containing protein